MSSVGRSTVTPSASQVVDEEAFVLVLREDEHEGEGAEALAESPRSTWRPCLPLTQRLTASTWIAARDDFVGDAELAVELERAGVDDEGARGRARFGGFVDDADADAEPGEPEGEDEAGGAGADDQHLGGSMRSVRHERTR